MAGLVPSSEIKVIPLEGPTGLAFALKYLHDNGKLDDPVPISETFVKKKTKYEYIIQN